MKKKKPSAHDRRKKEVTSEAQKRGPGKVDELGIQRGQNGEKGNTVRPENVREEKEAAH